MAWCLISPAMQTKERTFFFAMTAEDAKSVTFRGDQVKVNADGTAVVSDIKIFRSGTFRDNFGEQHTFEEVHLDQIVANFNLLRDNGIFIDVPVRRDHGRSVEQVAGYISDLRHEGIFIVADFAITRPSDVEGFRSGTYRNFSAEVGPYITNDEAMHWPVMMGVAAVDIPAIEGLFAKQAPDEDHTSFYSFTPQGDDDVTKPNEKPADVGASKPTATFRIAGAETSDFAAVQRHIDTVEATNASLTAEVTTLREFQSDQVKAHRVDFVKGLTKDGKIAAPMEEGLLALVVGTDDAPGMDDAAFEAFSKAYEAAPKLELFEKHGDGVSNTDGHKNDADEISVLEEQLLMHTRAGMKPEAIAKTKAAMRLAELKS